MGLVSAYACRGAVQQLQLQSSSGFTSEMVAAQLENIEKEQSSDEQSSWLTSIRVQYDVNSDYAVLTCRHKR